MVISTTMFIFHGLLSNTTFNWNATTIESGFLSVSTSNLRFVEAFGFTDLNFVLLVFSVVLLAASGNIINDYFDVKADRINKPKRLIIDIHIKRRWAIILNWLLNGIGFTLAVYLSFQLQNWWILTISFITINLLYFYSAIYKRKFLIGNLLVAFLTAIVPFYVFIYGGFSTFDTQSLFGVNNQIFLEHNLVAVLGYCGFAFFLNLIREIIKDMADVRGDKYLQSNTIPIKYGIRKTTVIISLLYIVVIVPLSLIIVAGFSAFSTIIVSSNPIPLFFYLLAGVVLFLIGSLIIMLTKKTSHSYLIAANLLKFAMLLGVLSALFYS